MHQAFRRAVESGKPAIIELRVNPNQITTRMTIDDMRAGKTPPKAAAKPKRAPAPAHPQPTRKAAAAGKKRG